MSARRWVDFLLPDSLTLQIDWLRDLVQGDAGLIARISRSPTARRMLARDLYKRHQVAVPERVALSSQQQWLLCNPGEQVALARRLGTEALHEFIRTTVETHRVAALRRQLGAELYKQALAGPGLPVQGMERAQFHAALDRERLTDHIVGVGAALLETTVRDNDPFCRMRMRFAFSPNCWQARPRNLRVDDAELAIHIDAATKA